MTEPELQPQPPVTTVSTELPEPVSPTASPAMPVDFSALKASLPAELRDNPSLRNYSSLEGMARSLIEAQRMVGKRIADATPEELGRFYARHGRPETPEGYALPRPEATEAPSELESVARQWFFEAGLSQRQAEALHARWSDFAAERQADLRAQAQEGQQRAERELRGEWGRAYDARLKAAARAARDFGGDELIGLLEETRLGDDPRVIRAFARIAARMGEDSLAGGERGDFALAPEAARQEIARLMTQPAYFDATHPEHDRSVARMKGLFAAAYPERDAHDTDEA